MTLSITLHLPSFHRDAPEATGDEAEDADLDEPKIYEKVSQPSWYAFPPFLPT